MDTTYLVSDQDLFQTNNHSNYQINFTPVSKELGSKLKKLVLEHYPLTNVSDDSFAQVAEVENASNNFRFSTNGIGGKKEFLLRKNIRANNKPLLEFLEKISAYLKQNDIPVSKTVMTRSVMPYCFADGHYWQVYEFINGNHYSGEESELLSMARATAILHKALALLSRDAKIDVPTEHFLPPWKLADLLKIVNAAQESKTSDNDKLFIANAEYILCEGRNVLEEFTKITLPRIQFIHGDLHPHNTIFANSSIKAILDFEMIRKAELLRDIGFVIHRFVRQYAVLSDGGRTVAQKGYSLFINEYKKNFAISKEEEKKLPVFIKEELLRRVVKDYFLHYFKGDSRYATAKELRKKIVLLKEVQYLC